MLPLYSFELVGRTSLLMHADDIELSDALAAWRKDPENKRQSIAGDDRSPSFTYTTYCYRNEQLDVVMPADNIMAALRKAGAQIIIKGKTTMKSASQSGLLITDELCQFYVNGKTINLTEMIALGNAPYLDHKALCEKHGFTLLCKRATIGSSKHVRVRPRFAKWSVKGTIQVTDNIITAAMLVQLFDTAGRISGLGDWRPSAPKSPGNFGMFTATLEKIG